MAYEPKIFDLKAEFVCKVAKETGVSEDQIRYIISILGYEYTSIVREAGILRRGGQ